jgi:putative colanic acid biosynthesis acetyltransferase WcaB
MHSFTEYIFQDWQINQSTSLKCRLILLLFRTTHYLSQSSIPFSFLSLPSRFFYQIIVEYILGVEIPYNTQIGTNLQLHHAHSLVINSQTIIGDNCILRHCTTIGNKTTADGVSSGCPQIGNSVEIGSNVVILGEIKIGDYSVIGAGSVVVKDVLPETIVAGNPAKIISQKNSLLDAKL